MGHSGMPPLKQLSSEDSHPLVQDSSEVSSNSIPVGTFLLQQAACLGDVENVKKMLSEGYNPNAQNEYNQTSLHLAVIHYQLDVVKVLLNCHMCDPNSLDVNLNTPLHTACKIGFLGSRSTNPHNLEDNNFYPEGIGALSDKTRSIFPNNSPSKDHDTNKENGESVAKQESDLEHIIKLLVSHPITNLNAVNDRNYAPLMYSCLTGTCRVAKILVTNGASHSICDQSGSFPLHVACENGHFEIVQLLVDHGAPVNAVDHNHITPLHLAASRNFTDICKLLMEHGANLSMSYGPHKLVPAQVTSDLELRHILSGMFTSSVHPLKVDFIDAKVLGKSHLGMSMCPGRNKKKHRRTLDMDIQTLVKNKTDVLVSLVQKSELTSMGIPDMLNKVNSTGIQVIHAPIADKWIPSKMKFMNLLIHTIIHFIKMEKCIVVHCNGGKGRTGLVVVATLTALGMGTREAITLIRSVREGMFYNPAQRLYLQLFRLNFKYQKDMLKGYSFKGIHTICNNDPEDENPYRIA